MEKVQRREEFRAIVANVIVWIIVALVLIGAVVFAQTPIKNPSGLAFTCPDHATDSGHEVAVVRDSDGSIVQTFDIGDPPLVGTEVVVKLNIQPVAFGRYRFKARASGNSPEGIVWSDWSDLTEVWERAPGKLTNLTIK